LESARLEDAFGGLLLFVSIVLRVAEGALAELDRDAGVKGSALVGLLPLLLLLLLGVPVVGLELVVVDDGVVVVLVEEEEVLP